jgi:predicted RNA-binding protein YlqC (UPF0109 family)
MNDDEKGLHWKRKRVVNRMTQDDLDKELRERDRYWATHGSGLPDLPDEENLDQFFRDLVSSYLNYPKNLKLELKEAEQFWALVLEPDVSDYAIVAGRLGRNFNALKTLVDGIGRALRLDIELLLEGPPKEDKTYIRKVLPYRVNLQWTPDALKSMVGRTLRLAGMAHIRLMLRKNTKVDENNPYNDQTFYWFIGMRDEQQVAFVHALGQLMESMGIAQGQHLAPRPLELVLEKTA